MAIYISDSNGILKKVAGAGGGSSGESIIVDSVLNSASANPVQNKALYKPVTFAENERKKSKNLLNLGNKTETINGVTVEVDNSKITMNGAPSNIGDIFIDIPEMTLKANKTYIYSIVVLNGKSKGSEPIPYTTSSIIIPNQAFTLTSDLVLNRLQIYMLNTQNQDVTFGVQIEEGSAITEWEDFSGKILHEIDLNEYYNKSEVDKLIDDIPETDLSEYYTKSETDDKINNNVNVKFAESERQKTLNMFNENAVIRGYSLSSSTGEILSDSIWYVSDYIDVQGLSSVIISGIRDSGQSNCFYDANKTFISTYKAIKGYIPVPSNAVYMRINGLISQLGDGYTNISQGNIVHENIIQGMAGVELWNNPNKSSSFTSQTITLSSSFANFDYLILEYEAYVPTNGVVNCRAYKYFRPMGGGSLEVLSGGWDGGERYIKARAFKLISETQIEVSSGYQEGTNNDRMIVPMRIYGVKKGV